MIRKLAVLFIVLGLIFPLPSVVSSAPRTPPPPPRNPDEAAAPRGPQLPAMTTAALELSQPAMPTLAPGDMSAWSRLVYQSYRNGQWDLFSARSNNSGEVRLTSGGEPEIEPRWTRGLTRIAYASREVGNYEIYAMNPDGTGKTRLTNVSASDYNPSWSPDGTKIVFSSYRDGQSEVYVMNANGSGLARLTNHVAYDGEPVWSPDGSKIAFTSTRGVDGQPGLWVMAADGHGPSFVASCESPAWSPDQQRFACISDWNNDGWYELRVVNADGSIDWQMIGLDGGYGVDILPRSWSPDGRYVAYTRVQYIYYRGNWYWYAAYLEAFDTTTRSVYRLSSQTEEWLPDWQTSDVQKPTSQVAALSSVSPSPFVVRWSGADAGPSGVLGYDVQVRDGTAGTWTTWLTRTLATTADYPGIGGHSYYFRSRAWDNSSNIEDWPAVPDASTSVEALPPSSNLFPLPEYQRDAASLGWSGSDPGGSGIASYDIQSRDGLTGTWTMWLTRTTSTAASFSGVAGHTYYFRSRAIDRAQNQEDWSASSDVVSTTFFGRKIAGTAYDTRQVRVTGASIALTPVALNSITSTLSGYAAYLLGTDMTYALTTGHIGYGVAPTMSVVVTGDVSADQYLPPSDNLLQNGDFEAGADLTGWQTLGTVPPAVTLTAHTGSRAALLRPDIEPNFGMPEAVGNAASHADMAVAGDGTVHVTYAITTGIFYTRRNITGTWSLPEQVATTSSVPALAWTPNGDVHIVWSNNGSILYRRKAAAGTWDASVSIVPWSGSLGIAAGSDGQVHVAVDGGTSSYCYNTVYYLKRDADGLWSSPASAVCASAPQLAVGADNVAHIVVQNAWNQGSTAFCDFSAPYWGCSSLGYGMSGVHIVIDQQNVVHLIGVPWFGAVHSIRMPGQGFVNEPLPGYNGNGDLAVDPAGNVFVAYAGGTSSYLTFKPVGGSWSEAQPLTEASVGALLLGSDASGVLHLVEEAGSGGLNYRQTLPDPQWSTSRLSQAVTIPVDLHQPTLSFLYRLEGVTSANPIGFNVAIETRPGVVAPFNRATNTADWTHGWLDLTPWQGQSITVTFIATATQRFSHTRLDLDEVTLGAWLTPHPQHVTPAHGAVQTPLVITLTGDNFLSPAQVQVDDLVLADVHWINTTTLTATVPSLSFGRHDILVTNPGGPASGLVGGWLVGYETFLPLVVK